MIYAGVLILFQLKVIKQCWCSHHFQSGFIIISSRYYSGLVFIRNPIFIKMPVKAPTLINTLRSSKGTSPLSFFVVFTINLWQFQLVFFLDPLFLLLILWPDLWGNNKIGYSLELNPEILYISDKSYFRLASLPPSIGIYIHSKQHEHNLIIQKLLFHLFWQLHNKRHILGLGRLIAKSSCKSQDVFDEMTD